MECQRLPVRRREASVPQSAAAASVNAGMGDEGTSRMETHRSSQMSRLGGRFFRKGAFVPILTESTGENADL